MGIANTASERGYFDHRFNARIINVAPGGQELASAPAEVLSTVLGSCVAACLRDHATGLGGMNHFLLPGDAPAPRPCPVRRTCASASPPWSC